MATSCSSQMDIIQYMSEWLSTCDTDHACAHTSLGSPTRLVDTKDHCIVPGNNGAPYLALSYTWRQNDIFARGMENYIFESDSQTDSLRSDAPPRAHEEGLQLLQANLPSLTKAGSLFRQHENSLPKVILDAVQLTELLGLRYLWVDRLCIIQDQEENKVSEEVMGMDQVYAGAYVTVVAAAAHGLFSTTTATFGRPEDRLNVRGSTRNGPLILQFKGKRPKHEDVVRHHYEALSRSAWAKRGWTYQESILSSRVVFFHDVMTFWHCDCAVWDMKYLKPDENAAEAARILSQMTFTKRFSTPSQSDFGLYIDLICPYNGREFTDQKDGLLGCLGILNRLAPAFPEGFLCGLPESFLDHALLWQPLKDCYRRVSKSVRVSTLPSWSWCGWRCFIDPWSFQTSSRLGADNQVKNARAQHWKLKRLVTWVTSMRPCKPTEAERIKVLRRPPAMLPSGRRTISTTQDETRTTNTEPTQHTDPSNILRCCLSGVTEHAFFLPAATLRFRWVIVQSPGIGCKLRVDHDPNMNERYLDDLSNVVVLRDRTSAFSGLLRTTKHTKCGIGQQMELIAMSEGSATFGDMKKCFEEKVFRLSPYYSGKMFHADFDENDWWVSNSDRCPAYDRNNYKVEFADNSDEKDLILPKEESDDTICEFYNVLWVERGDDHIAHRVGCGRVLKDRWKQNEPQSVEVTLG